MFTDSDNTPHQYHQYTMEEDGFHSISWDDAPPARATTGFADMSAVGAADDDDDDGFDKISATSPLHEDAPEPSTSRPPQPQTLARGAAPELDIDDLWGGRWMSVTVSDPVKEHEGSKDMYVSYAVKTQVSTAHRVLRNAPTDSQTNLPTFEKPSASVRRRFQDFVFLRDHLAKSFPACVIPPIPDKHRLGELFVCITELTLQSTSRVIGSRPSLLRSAG